jgi:hypothetical protein
MSENLYAPPAAVVSDPPQVASTPPAFFAVSPLKLVVLSFGFVAQMGAKSLIPKRLLKI